MEQPAEHCPGGETVRTPAKGAGLVLALRPFLLLAAMVASVGAAHALPEGDVTLPPEPSGLQAGEPVASLLAPVNELHRQVGWRQRLPGASFRGGDPSGSARGLRWDDSVTNPAPIRSPRLSFVLSAILPGAGQLYNGSQRGYLFLALEATSWFVRGSYLDAADRKEADSRDFADRHWDFDRFLGSVNDDGCGFAPGADTLLAGFAANDLDRYYKEIANGGDYQCGWDDAVFDPSRDEIVSARRAEFRDRRETRNTFQSRAGLALGVIVLNRVVSAVDAFRMARGRETGKSPSFRVTGAVGGNENGPEAVFRLTKELP